MEYVVIDVNSCCLKTIVHWARVRASFFQILLFTCPNDYLTPAAGQANAWEIAGLQESRKTCQPQILYNEQLVTKKKPARSTNNYI